MSKEIIASFKDISIIKNKKSILQIENLEIRAGDKICIIGANGSGKTTFQKLFLNRIYFEGTRNTSLTTNDIAVHLQENNYDELLKVKELIYLITGRPLKSTFTDDAFSLNDLLNVRVGKLSGGELQRLTIFLVTYKNSKVTFFDEATTGLDFKKRQEIIKLISKITKDQTLLIISHYFNELEHLVDKLLILDFGKVIYFGTRDNYLLSFSQYSFVKYVCDKDLDMILQDYVNAYVLSSDENIIAVKNYIGNNDTIPLNLELAYEVDLMERKDNA